MPIYEYRCESCGRIVELIHKINDPAPQICDSCGGKMRRLISRTSFILNGSGWYVTEYGYKKDVSKKESSSGIKSSNKESSN